MFLSPYSPKQTSFLRNGSQVIEIATMALWQGVQANQDGAIRGKNGSKYEEFPPNCVVNLIIPWV
jgi:hypothetical protein